MLTTIKDNINNYEIGELLTLLKQEANTEITIIKNNLILTEYNKQYDFEGYIYTKTELVEEVVTPVLPSLEDESLSDIDKELLTNNVIKPSLELFTKTLDTDKLFEDNVLLNKLSNINTISAIMFKVKVDKINTITQLANIPMSDMIKTNKKYYLNMASVTFEQAISMITTAYPKHEQKTWDKQEIEAKAYLANNTTPTPLLDGIVLVRGVNKDLLVSKIIEKADAFTTLSGIAIGYRQKAEDILMTVTDITSLNEALSTLTTDRKNFRNLFV